MFSRPRFFDDLRLAVRGLLRGGAAGPLAVLVLALGIGATTALFSLVDGLLLRPLPYDHPEELVRLYETFRYPGGEGLGSVSYPNFVDWRDRQEGFAGMAAYSAANLAFQGGGRPERLASVEATPGLFDVIGVAPALGRGFRPEDGAADASPVAVLAHRIWATRFGSDPEVLGRTVTLDGRAHTVVGVMPEGFEFPPGGRAEDVWVSLDLDPAMEASRGSHWLAVVGRLAPTTSLTAAGAEMDRLADGIREAYPEEQEGRGAVVKPLQEVMVGSVRPALLLLFGGTGLVLLIACANGANLLLLRAEGRRREVAVRAALGAGSRQIAAQFFAEAVVLVGSAALLGLGLGRLALTAFSELAATALPVAPRVGFDWRVFAFLVATSAVMTIALALVPSFQARAARIQDSLREGGGAVGAGRQARRFRGFLVASQVALSVVLLSSTGLLLRTFLVLSGTELGFQPEKVLTLQVSLPEASYPEDEMAPRFYESVRREVEALPGVERAGWISHVPLQDWGMNGNFNVEGRPTPERVEDQPFAELRVVGPGYFEAVGVPLLRGRPISPDDRDESAPVAWINRSLAETYFPGEDPLEQRLLAYGTSFGIAGVVGDVRSVRLEQAPSPEIYIPYGITGFRDMALMVRTGPDPTAMIPAVRRAVADIDPALPVYGVLPLSEVVSGSLSQRKLSLALAGLFGLLALVLTVVGLYGTVSAVVAHREREIGIRVALGAQSGSVLRLVIGHGARLAALGLVLGVPAALGAGVLLSGLLYGVPGHDPGTFGAVVVALLAVSLVASYLPARRALAIDPVTSLRSE